MKRSAVTVTMAMLALTGCGSDNQTESTNAGAATAKLPTTDRPELAFWTDYAVGTADDRGEHRQLVVGKPTEGEVFPQLFSSVTWSPDGGRIAFEGVADEQTDEHNERTEIYSVRPDGSDLEQITEVGDADGPLWLPGGDTIVFTRITDPVSEGGGIKGSLWSINTDGSGLTQIAEASDWEVFTAGSFTPDGSELAVTRTEYQLETGETTSEIQLVSPNGSDRRSLIDQARDPAFSPDGGRIAFSSDRDENGELCYGDQCSFGGELYIAAADGSDLQRLTETNAVNEVHPSWTPDGSRLAYQRGEVFENAEATSIFAINADGSCIQTLLKGRGPGAWYASPAWRPSQPKTGSGPLRC